MFHTFCFPDLISMHDVLSLFQLCSGSGAVRRGDTQTLLNCFHPPLMLYTCQLFQNISLDLILVIMFGSKGLLWISLAPSASEFGGEKETKSLSLFNLMFVTDYCLGQTQSVTERISCTVYEPNNKCVFQVPRGVELENENNYIIVYILTGWGGWAFCWGIQ